MKKATIILTALLWFARSFSQPIGFQHLNTTNGLSYIMVNNMCVDNKGNLWIATVNGLNMFNGKTVEKYFSSDNPQLNSSNIQNVVCDLKNRIWVLTAGGYVTMIDEKRQMHRVSLYNENKPVRVLQIFKSNKYGAILWGGKGIQFLKENVSYNPADSITNKHFDILAIPNWKQYNTKGRNRSFQFSDEHYLLVYSSAFLKIRYSNNTIERRYDIPNSSPLIRWGNEELLFLDRATNEIKSLNLTTEEIKYPFKDVKDQHGVPINAMVNFAQKLTKDRFLFTTTTNGIYIYDKHSNTLTNYKHELTDPSSLCNNLVNAVTSGENGWVFIACNPNGISYFNANETIGTQTVFTDDKGNGYDGYISGIATKDNETYYIGTLAGLLKWKRRTNKSEFIDFYQMNDSLLFNGKELVSIVIDENDNIWTTVQNDGVAVVSKDKKLIKFFKNEAGNKNSLKQKATSRIKPDHDGYMWICGRNGICRINAKTFEIDNFENTVLQRFDSLQTTPFFADKDYMWISASTKGLYQYHYKSKQLTEHTGFRKYKSEGIYDMHTDSAGTLYVANSKGVRIFFKDGREKRINEKDGLLISRAEGLLLDKHNRMWIGNDIGLACYDPADSSLKVFDGRYGLSMYGFRVGSYFQTPNGEFILGTPKGLQYFYPDSLYNKKIRLNVLINKIETKSIVSSLTDNSEFKLKASNNQVTFHFGSVDFNPNVRSYYEYKLVDLDKEWIKVADQNSVRYSSLPPGKYVFKVRVSNDNKTWQESDNEVTIIVAAPFYQAGWFKMLGILIGLFLIWYVFKYYQRKQLKQREELEAQVVINYFASQINRHLKTEDILWDVAKNCISKLNFEDCVIYMLDEDRNVLVQKAAWGPKLAKDLTIHQPIEIPVGEGIVGSVAQTGKPELIVNTEMDKRYIADDARRFSELAVPLIINNKVIGVIDSEHSRKNFFTKRHLNILSTIAVLCATQIERAKAEQDEKEAQLVINYFASQIHSRYNSDELLWDLAKNLIGKLEFQDCMIYLWNEDRSMLIQKAGYGIKGSMQEIIDRTAYHIPKGKGIVGAAVESGQSTLVNDTSKDERYFTADGKIMLSELCVPLVHNNEVLGAINTEHPAKNFYTTRHLKMLSTIAGLCAGQLKHIRTEEEKQQARIELLENKRRAMESRLQSLRLQMNPHFLFNALNSVQQMILANEEMIATKYLSKFSKLLRSILVHSDKETVTLKEEIEVLKLYVELESIRFKESFHYEISCDEDIDVEEIKIPTLLIQPFVENAIWHGLMHKEGNRELKVQFAEEKEFIQCIVEDNGIGRQKAKEMKITTGQDKKHTSKGIQVSEERLRSMQNNGTSGSIEIKDLVDGSNKPTGTRIEIYFPTKSC